MASTRRETHDTWTLRLEPAETDGALAPFAPGQFAMLYAFGAGEVPISVSATGGEDGALAHTIRAVGAVTRRLCALREGEAVWVRGPFGTGWPMAAARGRDVILIAGGIGMAPLRPVVHALLHDRERYGHVSVLYGGRSPGDLLYPSELEGWRGRTDVACEVIVDTAGPGWRGRVGLVTRLVPPIADPGGTVAMICGPDAMMRFTLEALADRGLGPERAWLSIERSMKCATGHCGRCQLGPLFVCQDGPVVRGDVVGPLARVREL